MPISPRVVMLGNNLAAIGTRNRGRPRRLRFVNWHLLSQFLNGNYIFNSLDKRAGVKYI
jgi:hypothetical protein